MKKFEDLMKGLDYENLEKPEAKEEEIEKFTNEELEEKIGIVLRLFDKETIKKSIFRAQLNEFSYQLNKLAHKKDCTIESLIDYFNQVSGGLANALDN